MTDNINDNELVRGARMHREPDAHGQAAMLLVESLIHALVSKSVLSVADAIEVVDTAVEVKLEIATDLGDSPETLRESLAMLESIGTSLRSDIDRPSM